MDGRMGSGKGKNEFSFGVDEEGSSRNFDLRGLFGAILTL